MQKDSIGQPKDYAWNLANFNGMEKIYSRRRQNSVVEELLNDIPHRILEIGGGLNSLANFLPNFFLSQCELHILEPNVSLFESLISSHHLNSNIFLYNDNCESFSKRNEIEFDFVIANSVLHEVDDPLLFLKSAKKTMKSGSKLWINVPNINSLHRKIYSSKARKYDYQISKYGRKHYFGAEDLEELLFEIGFERLRFASSILKPMTDEQLFELIMNSENGRKVFDYWLKYKDFTPPFVGAELDFLFYLS